MHTRTPIGAICAIVLALCAVSHDAAAQFPGGMRGGGMRDRGTREQKPEAPTIRRNVLDEVDERLYLFQEDLRLAPAQESLWTRYADGVRAMAGDIARDRGLNEVREKVPVLQRLDTIVNTARNRLTAMEDINAAAKSLYDTLTPQQRDVADPRLATIVALLIVGTPDAPREAPRARR